MEMNGADNMAKNNVPVEEKLTALQKARKVLAERRAESNAQGKKYRSGRFTKVRKMPEGMEAKDTANTVVPPGAQPIPAKLTITEVPWSQSAKSKVAGETPQTPKDTGFILPLLPPPQPIPTHIDLPPTSAQARDAKKVARTLLDEHFDVDAGRYRHGYNDGRIARESDLSADAVAAIRELAYGSLRTLDEATTKELASLKGDIASLSMLLEECKRRLRTLELDVRA